MSTDLAKLIADNFKKFGKPIGVGPATLTKVTPGTRMPGAPTAGTNPTTRSFTATGLVAGFTAFELQDTLIKASDRKVVLFGASIESGAVPEPTDRVAIGGDALVIVRVLDRDPAKATYTLQCRA